MIPESEINGMRRIIDHFNNVAESMESMGELMAGWLPARSAVDVVCNVDWDSLMHGQRTAVGALLRDTFADDFPKCRMTPVCLLRKTSGSGSHMIAIYPPWWLMQQKDRILDELNNPDRRHGQLLFFEDVALVP